MTRRRYTITRRLVESLPNEPRILWDDDCRKLGLRVWPSGYRAYIVQAREPSGRIRRATLTSVTRFDDLRTVRIHASRAILAIQDGAATIPGCARSRPKSEVPTFEAVAGRFMAEHAATHKKATSIASDKSLLKEHLLPELGELKIDSICRERVARFHRSLANKPYLANRCLALLSTIFSFADQAGIVPPNTNPCKGVQRYRERARTCLLAPEELARLYDALDAAAGREHPSTLLAVRLLILTGARRNEILTLRWSDVDFEHEVAFLRDSKTGPRPLLLGAAGTALLRTAPREAGNDRVCWGVGNITRPWQRLRAAAGLPELRLHDLRHACASAAVAAGVPLLTVGRLLGHSSPAMTNRYAHLGSEPLRAALETIQSALTPKETTE